MGKVAADLTAALAGAGSLFLLLDFFLSVEAKRRLLDALTRWWLWLDQAADWKTFDWLRGRSLLLFAFSVAIIVLGFLVLGWQADSILVALGLAGLLLPAVVTGPWLLRTVVGETKWGFLWLPVLMTMVTLDVYDLTKDLNGHQVSVPLGMFVGYLFVTTGFIDLACLPLWLTPAFKAAIRGLELTIRRLAEYPKGPLLGISGVLGALAGGLKLFV
ncbi:hypothetical protein [Bradyrhizobium arachidis]|uniref:Uncharacterized protein n=1 Tax=Bradyrhizobium arachidis TaxID=858423 RepID=A0AAE7NUR0_9BRAD|nr:hypothetical protein [Bradyrhizobium arachidis]QOZ69139.1 hypothetical protein WN72_24570 [Bradyrhizobium arachidis]SFV01059.1 hypothetical protein SAMN05192541_109293 [Bradyrhizobium arachidis]